MKSLLLKLFSKEDVNTGRQYEFDYVKALCIFIMVVMHTYIKLCESATYQEGSLSYFITFTLCTIFGASTFMICMGIGFCYTKNRNNPDFFINRGIKTLILSYVLNLTRALINILLVNPKTAGTFLSARTFTELLEVDIMQFAGVAMILFGILLKLKLKPLHILITGIILSLISSFFPYVSTGNGILDLLLGLFVPNKYLNGEGIFSAFPLISYFIYPAFGYIYGIYDKRIKDKKTFYSIVTPICGFIAIGYSIIASKYNFPCTTDLGYYHPYTYDCFINILGTIFLFGLFYFISKITPNAIEKLSLFTSSHINTVYCIHWVILANLSGIITILNNYQYRELDEGHVTIIGLAIYIVSVIITKFYSDYKTKRKTQIHNS